jgi:hypothetical protein
MARNNLRSLTNDISTTELTASPAVQHQYAEGTGDLLDWQAHSVVVVVGSLVPLSLSLSLCIFFLC